MTLATPASPSVTRLARGGVSPKPGEPAVHGSETVRVARGAPPAAAAFPGFTYHGGPVITCPLVYTSFWGPSWLSDPAHLLRAGRLSQFHEDLLRSGFMNVLSQYGVGFGAGAGGAFVRATFVSSVPSTLTDNAIHGILQVAINAGVLPEPGNPSNNAVIIYLDESIGINDPGNPVGPLVLCEPTNDSAFGYHNFFLTAAGHPCYYAVIPGLTDACLKESCPLDVGCSLHLSETQEQRQTQAASHEFAEMTTDPQINAWLDDANGENGDICNGEPDLLTVGPNTWTVQRIYSKYDDNQTNGASHCRSQAPSPEPRLSPGPAARPAALARAQTMPSFERLLPLPSVRFDANSLSVVLDDQEVRAYTQKLFEPLRPEHALADLPGFLHQVADTLTKA